MIDFKELSIPFHRLALGTILIDPDDARYLKVLSDEMEDYWVNDKDWWNNSALSDTQMKNNIGGGEGWKVLP